MTDSTFLGIDDHEKNLAVQLGISNRSPMSRTFPNTARGHRSLRDWVTKVSPAGSSVLSAYEAGPFGPRLAKALEAFGWTCYVLAPHATPKSGKTRKQKCDLKDARRILDVLRGHVLGGSEMTTVWLPDDELLDHRELVRERLDVGDKITRVKNQIHGLLKRHGIKRPSEIKSLWSKAHVQWLGVLCHAVLSFCTAFRLKQLLRQFEFFKTQKKDLDDAIDVLASHPRYRKACAALTAAKGIGTLTAMVFLTELGDLNRFPNRRKVAAYLGLVPSLHDTGEKTGRQGHITRFGSPRVRNVLNQAAWAMMRDAENPLRAWYTALAKKAGKKKAIVALMRRQSIIMWHTAKDAV